MAALERSNRVKELISNFLYSTESENGPLEENNATDAETGGPSQSLPRDKEAFVKRVESFTTLSWYAKPSTASPLECARYGWLNSETDLLKCVSCKAILSGELPKNTQSQAYQDSCKKLTESLKSAHKSACPWPHNPSPDNFVKIYLHEYNKVLAEYQQRFTQLQNLGDRLPVLTHDAMADQLPLCGDLIRAGSDMNNDDNTTQNTEVQQCSALLAVAGWTSSTPSKDLLHCSYCQRKVGLWNFNQLSERSDSSVTSSQPENKPTEEEDFVSPSKRQKKSKGTFCPVSEHKTWCPWVTRDSANESDSDKPPWKQLISKLTRQIDGRSPNTLKDSPQEGLRNVRKILKDWTSPIRL